MTSRLVDGALDGSPESVGPTLLAMDEDQWFERKSARIHIRDLAKAIVAFANAEGGTVVVGLHGGTVEGIDARRSRVNDLRQASIDGTEPPVRIRCDEVECVVSGAPDHLLVIRVAPGERVHRTVQGDCYLRIGDESRKLTFAQERELLYDRGQSQYDGEPAGVAESALDERLLDNYASAIAHPDGERILNARSLLTPDGAVTNAAYLLFGKDPQVRFPQAEVRIIRYLSMERGVGSRLTIAEDGDVRVGGNLPSMIERARVVIEQLVPQRRALGPDGRFVPTPLVPRDAWLEGLVNAVVHRSYSLAGDHIRFEIFNNRIEIESPGRFPGLVDLSRPMNVSRYARNPRIARVCADLRITQELGEGIRRIFEEMRRAGLEDPMYEQSSGSVRLILTSNPALDPRLAGALPHGAVDVLRLIEATTDRQLGTGDVAEAMGIARPTATRRLQALRDAGLVEWHGKGPRDPRAYWTAAGRGL